jgi:hypothetical protein
MEFLRENIIITRICAMEGDSSTRRLFVPLASEPFRWFTEGQKQWELRKYGRQYTERHVWVGRRIELRRGYSSKESLWGVIMETVHTANVRDFFGKVNYKIVIPAAQSEVEAIEMAERILGISSGTDIPVLGFRVEIEI